MNASALNGFLAQLTSFAKETRPVAPPGLDWDELVDIAFRHGLAALISYQLDYRFLAQLTPPPQVREQLAAGYNAAVNDNVLKVTHLRRLLSGEGMPEVVVLGPPSFIDGLYPHVAFRPIDDVEAWIPAAAQAAAQQAFAAGGLAPHAPGAPRQLRSVAARFASPDIALSVWSAPAGVRLDAAQSAELWSRKVALRAYGPSAHRLDPADAVIAHLAGLALDAFAVPRIRLIDLREMVLRFDAEQGGGGFYGPRSLPLRSADVLARARQFGLTRSLWAGLRVVGELFPEAAPVAERLARELTPRTARLLDEAVVRPALDLKRTRVVRAAVAVRRMLLG